MKKSNVRGILIVSVLVSFILGAVGSFLVIENVPTVQNIITSSITYTEEESIADGVSSIYDAVVVVEAYSDGELASTGTGFVYKQSDGVSYILTNHHVISDMDSVKIMLSDETMLDAKVMGSETYSDIAVLSVTSDKIETVAKIGDSTELKVGDTVFAIGAPEGSDYAGSVTKGVLSGKDRLIAVALGSSYTSDYYMKVLQTDAAINPGNSGGPLCNADGEVIGITNMKMVDDSVEGMGFAIPIEDAILYAETLEKGEEIVRPYFGIGMLDVSDSYYLWQSGIILSSDITSGVVITEVASDSPAEKSGLKKGDVILSINETEIDSVAEFRYELYKLSVGDIVEVKYYRNNKIKSTEVTLASSN